MPRHGGSEWNGGKILCVAMTINNQSLLANHRKPEELHVLYIQCTCSLVPRPSLPFQLFKGLYSSISLTTFDNIYYLLEVAMNFESIR